MSTRTAIFLSIVASGDVVGEYEGQIRDAFPDVSLVWPEGTDAAEADLFFFDSATLAGGATDTIDLTALVDAEGNALAFAEVRLIALRAPASNPGRITIGTGATNGFPLCGNTASHALAVPAGSTVLPLLCPVDGAWPVSAGDATIDIINLDGGASAAYDLLIIGTSA